MSSLQNWHAKGFSAPPDQKTAPAKGLLIYRAWGEGSTEFGTGYFSLEKPSSVLDAELRFNIADWGNGVHFVSTFKMKAGSAYFVGPVAHGSRDLSRPGHQILLEPPIHLKVTLVRSREVLRHDVTVVQRSGRA
jgi:hypothetical protein